MWNLPFSGISVAMGGITVDKIVTDPGLRQLALDVMDETIAVANMDLERIYGPDGYDPLGEQQKEYCMNLSDTMGPYRPSTMLDLMNRRPMEVKYLFEKPLSIARKLGVPVPHLETIVAQIAAYQRIYDLY
jgi:2-dehydropantoate 2-reductase